MDTCPNCHRKLLCHTSIRCNWCGAEINDEGYQQQAAQERALFRAHEAERDAIEAARSAAIVNSAIPGWGRSINAFGIIGNSWQRRREMEALARAQARAMKEYAQTGQAVGGVRIEQPTQPPAAPNQPPQNPAGEEKPTQDGEVRSMFRHLEL